MIFRKISGIKQPVSGICLGTGQYGSQLNEDSSYALMDRYVEMGGNFLDSAHIYGAWDEYGVNHGCGNSEVVIGRWLKRRGNRDRMIIATKGGHPDLDSKASGMTRSTLLQHLHESLERLQLDFVDLYWFHRDDRSIPVSEILGWLEEPCKQGLNRAIGCSNWRIDRLAEAMAFVGRSHNQTIGARQIAWSLAEEDGPYGEQLAMDIDTWRFHIDSQIPLAAYSSQAQGFFAEKYDICDFASADFPNPGLIDKYGSDLNLRRRVIAQEIAHDKCCTTNQVALAWLLHQPFPTLTVIGPHNIEQLEDSMGGTTVELSDNEVRQLREPK